VIYVVDTHAIVWFLRGSGVGARARAALRSDSSELILPTIVLAEIKYLKARGRIQPSLSAVMQTIDEDPRFTVYPFDEGVLRVMPVGADIHDAIIIGTALLYREVRQTNVRVISRDPAIASSSFVQTVW